MKIGFFGDGPWSHKSLEKLLSDKRYSVEFICVRFNNPDNFLLDKSRVLGIDLLIEKNINEISFQKKLKKYNCDLFVSMSFDQIFKKETFNIPNKGTINCHAGKLPLYRGRNILNWALINGESEFGITVHFIDEGDPRSSGAAVTIQIRYTVSTLSNVNILAISISETT